jgi:hypothetical protein
VAAKQREHILQKTLTLSNAHVVRPGVTAPLEGGRAALLATLPGLSDTPWRPREVTYELHAQPQSLEQVLAAVYRAVCAEDNAKPFEKPVARLVGSAACPARGRRHIRLSEPSEGLGLAYAPRSAASATCRLAVASAARFMPPQS